MEPDRGNSHSWFNTPMRRQYIYLVTQKVTPVTRFYTAAINREAGAGGHPVCRGRPRVPGIEAVAYPMCR
jgi:hypothetical protein